MNGRDHQERVLNQDARREYLALERAHIVRAVLDCTRTLPAPFHRPVQAGPLPGRDGLGAPHQPRVTSSCSAARRRRRTLAGPVSVLARSGRSCSQRRQCLQRLPICSNGLPDRNQLCGACAACRQTGWRRLRSPAGIPVWQAECTARGRVHAVAPCRPVATPTRSGAPDPYRRVNPRSTARGNETTRSR